MFLWPNILQMETQLAKFLNLHKEVMHKELDYFGIEIENQNKHNRVASSLNLLRVPGLSADVACRHLSG